jgi:hypothetical protein
MGLPIGIEWAHARFTFAFKAGITFAPTESIHDGPLAAAYQSFPWTLKIDAWWHLHSYLTYAILGASFEVASAVIAAPPDPPPISCFVFNRRVGALFSATAAIGRRFMRLA